MFRRDIAIGQHLIPYFYGLDCTDEVVTTLTGHFGDATAALLVADRAVSAAAHGIAERLATHTPVDVVLMTAEESGKTLAMLESVADHAVRKRLTRDSFILAMGGGMVGNVAGLTAALLYRGIRFAHLPTTPVAAFDSVISLKQAVNLSGGKNLFGAYAPASVITCDLTWLTTVPHRHLMNGLAEMVKNVLVVTPWLEEMLLKSLDRLRTSMTPDVLLDLLTIGIEAKAPLLQTDPKERKEALVFEYGHTAGHAIEFASDGLIGHGEAVAWGMLVAAEVSRALGYLDPAEVRHHYALVRELGLTDAAARLRHVRPDRVRHVLASDNKRGAIACSADEVPMVLLRAAADPVRTDGYPLVPVPLDNVMTALRTVGSGQRPS